MSINPQELAELCKDGKKIDLIDVRTPVEFREVHVEIARNVPLDQLDVAALMKARNGSANEPLYVICRSGSRGQQACEKFLTAGFSNVVNIEGGTMACVEAGLPVVRDRKAISLERQVRIAAGSLVLLGAGLSFVHPVRHCAHAPIAESFFLQKPLDIHLGQESTAGEAFERLLNDARFRLAADSALPFVEVAQEPDLLRTASAAEGRR